MMQPDSNSLNVQDPELEMQQKADMEMAEDQAPYLRPFLQAEEEVTDTGIIDQVFWGAARALRLPGRQDAGNHGISRQLILPTGTTEGKTSNSSLVTTPPRRPRSMNSVSSADLEPSLSPAYAETMASPVPRQTEPMRVPRAPRKASRPSPASHESSMGPTQRKLVNSLPFRPKQKHIIYTHSSMHLLLRPDFEAPAANAIPLAKKRRSRATEEFEANISDDEEHMQPVKKKRSVRLAAEQMDANQPTPIRKSTLPPSVSTFDQVADPRPLSTLSPYDSAWDQVPKSPPTSSSAKEESGRPGRVVAHREEKRIRPARIV